MGQSKKQLPAWKFMPRGDRLRFVRKKLLGLSQTEVADQLKIKQQTYSRAESTHQFSDLFCEKINRCAIRYIKEDKNKTVYLNLEFLKHANLPVFRKAGELIQMDNESLAGRVQQLEIEVNRLGYIEDVINADRLNQIILDAISTNQIPLKEKKRLVAVIQRIANEKDQRGVLDE